MRAKSVGSSTKRLFEIKFDSTGFLMENGNCSGHLILFYNSGTMCTEQSVVGGNTYLLKLCPKRKELIETAD